ncbi:MAG: ATP-binding protein, partial [Bacteroidota bacterium]
AVKFCREGDAIQIKAQPRPEVGLNRIEIKDSGVGISEEDQKKLFGKESFSTRGTRNERGTGLGLRICSDFITLMGGRIWVESSPELGSTFSFELPQAADS